MCQYSDYLRKHFAKFKGNTISLIIPNVVQMIKEEIKLTTDNSLTRVWSSGFAVNMICFKAHSDQKKKRKIEE